MKKTLLCFFSVASILFAHNTFAETENGFFLGLNLDKSIKAESTIMNDVDSETKKSSFDSYSYSLSAGYRTASNNRIIASYAKISAKNKHYDVTFSGLDLDWQFVYGSRLVQPFWGLGFGSYSQDDSAKFNDGKDLSAFSLQLMTGAKFDLNDQFELSATYHVRTMVWESVEVANVSETSIDSISSIQLSAVFKF